MPSILACLYWHSASENYWNIALERIFSQHKVCFLECYNAFFFDEFRITKLVFISICCGGAVGC